MKIANVEIKRAGNKIQVQIELAPEIENLFKNEDVSISSVYHSNGGAFKFYRLVNFPRFLFPKDYTISDYGEKLFLQDNLNFSIVRTVGISNPGGISFDIKGLVSKEDLEEWVKIFKEFIVILWKKLVQKVTIKMTLTTEEIV